jgi:hypothetical protein
MNTDVSYEILSYLYTILPTTCVFQILAKIYKIDDILIIFRFLTYYQFYKNKFKIKN